MKLFPPSPQENANRNAIFWALLSQSIWLPVFISGAQEKWSVNHRDGSHALTSRIPDQFSNVSTLDSSAVATQLKSRSLSDPSLLRRQSTGIVLNSVFVEQRSANSSRTLTDTSSPNAATALARPVMTDHSEGSGRSGGIAAPALTVSVGPVKLKLFSNGFARHLYSRSELLGGTLTLQDLAEPMMPPMARAERAQWSRSGDPLAPLPELWREPMRRALKSLVNNDVAATQQQNSDPSKGSSLESARFVHVPSSKIRRASEVPLALQADGTVDILNQPDDPAVIEEINRWSTKQKLPGKGKISPAVVHLHPMAPLKTDSSAMERSKSASAANMQPQAAEQLVAPTPAPIAIAPPAAVSVQDTSSGSDLAPMPISSSPPEVPQLPDQSPSGEAES